MCVCLSRSSIEGEVETETRVYLGLGGVELVFNCFLCVDDTEIVVRIRIFW